MKTYTYRASIEIRARNLEAAQKKLDKAVRPRKDVAITITPVQMGFRK